MNAHPLDLAVIVGYFLLVMALGLSLGRGVRDGRDYFLAGRSLVWWVIGFSIIGTNLDASGYIGASGGAFQHGIAQANFEWIGAVPAMVLACFIFIPLYWRAGVWSVPEYLGRRYSPAVRIVAALLTIFVTVMVTGTSLWAIALTLETYLGLPIWVGVLVTALVVGSYSVLGGLAAVVFTDTLQVLILMVGGVVLLWIGVDASGGVTELVQRVQSQGAQHFDVYLAADHASFPWTGVLFGLGLVLSPAYWIGSQAILQRTLGARSAWDASAAMMLAAFAKLLVPLIIIFPGFLALALYADIEYPDQALPWVITHVLPPGLSGLMFVAIIAALQSTLDSGLNAVALLVSRDLMEGIGRRVPPERTLLTGRLLTLGALAAGVCVIPVVSSFSGIYQFIQTMLSLFQGPMLALLLFGALTRTATARAGEVTLVGGVLFASLLWWNGVNLLWTAFLSFVAAAVCLWLVSRLTSPPSAEELVDLVWTGRRSA